MLPPGRWEYSVLAYAYFCGLGWADKVRWSGGELQTFYGHRWYRVGQYLISPFQALPKTTEDSCEH